MRSLRFFLALILTPLAVVACGDELRGPEVILANHSNHDLQNVTLSGAGFMTSVGRVRAHSIDSTIVHPLGESSIRVTFSVDGKTIDSGECCRFDNNPMHKIAVNIDQELGITVMTNLVK